MSWPAPSRGPRVFAVPPGQDFVADLAAGLASRFAGAPPEALARLTVLVPTGRMARRLTEALAARGPGFLPNIRLIESLALDPVAADLPPPVSQLRRRLELSRLVGAWLAQRGAPPASQLWDLTDALTALLDDMQAEGVTPTALRQLDASDESGHWQQALTFLTIAANWFDGADLPGTPARLRQAVARLDRAWRRRTATDRPDTRTGAPPPDLAGPVLVAGSTGSRAATAALIEAVARRADGAVVLPAFDRDLPDGVWARLDDPLTGEDHPQFRLARLLDRLGLAPADVAPWHSPDAPVPSRARLLSLALRPPPQTDAWLAEGPLLGDLVPALDGVTLVEAPTPRHEAEVIALRLRQTVAEGRTAALVTPDRTLARRVTAVLDRWDLRPDDSAGEPLSLSPPGRLLRQVAAEMGQPPRPEPLLALLKHPLVHAGSGRARHLRRTQALELALRRKGLPVASGPGAAEQAGAAVARLVPTEDGPDPWRDWLVGLVRALAAPVSAPQPLADLAARLRDLAETASRGATGTGAGALWDERSGRATRALMERLATEADAPGPMVPRDLRALLDHLLSREVARDRDDGHPQILIRGVQEWRAEGADLVILGGLAEGTWPARPAPDPWLNRRMRHALGLPLPDRATGLSAHDYWHAVNAPEVWLTRSLRSADGPLAPARWLDRLENLAGGLGANGGRAALRAMRQRGAAWLDAAAALDRPDAPEPPAPRPSPCPPVTHRPTELSVTEFERLNRDPYAIYARRILRLAPLDPLAAEADAAERGTILHRVVEPLAQCDFDPAAPDAVERFLAICTERLDSLCPWPAQRHLWFGQLARVAPRLVAAEVERRSRMASVLQETPGRLIVHGVTLTGRPDRIDIAPDGTAWVYDYKSGQVPSKADQALNRQLQLLAAMIERGAFGEPRAVRGASYLALSGSAEDVDADFETHSPADTWAQLERILAMWADPAKGYTAQSVPPQDERRPGDYDHLARFGEWDRTTPPTGIRLP